MLPKVQIIVGEEVAVSSPYDKGFVSRSRAALGEWVRDEGVWVFPLEAKDKVVRLAKAVYGAGEVLEGLLPREPGLGLYRAAVYPHPDRDFKGEVLLALVYSKGGKPLLEFSRIKARRAGSLIFEPGTFAPNWPQGMLPLPEQFLPEEVEMAIRWKQPYSTPSMRGFPEDADEKVRRFLETGSLGECASCGGPLWGYPFRNIRTAALCLRCGKAQDPR